jgi:hypothetical protein
MDLVWKLDFGIDRVIGISCKRCCRWRIQDRCLSLKAGYRTQSRMCYTSSRITPYPAAVALFIPRNQALKVISFTLVTDSSYHEKRFFGTEEERYSKGLLNHKILVIKIRATRNLSKPNGTYPDPNSRIIFD